jgi:hypothetical protein
VGCAKAAIERRGVTDIAADSEDQARVAGGHTDVENRPSPASEHDRRIRVVTSRAQLALLIAGPIAAALVLVAFARDPMFISGLLAVIAVFIVFQVFASRIPDAFERLTSRGVIGDEQLASFPEFKAATERALNSPIAVVVAVAFAVMGFARFPVQAGGLDQFGNQAIGALRAGRPLIVYDALGEAVLGFILGFVAWRMLVIAARIIQLGRDYDLRIQVGHPDGCGGFRPVGDLCLWNGLLLSVPAIFLGFWLPLAGEFGYGTRYTGLHTILLGVLIGLAVVMFVAPMWSIHIAMRRDAERIRKEIDEVGRRIDQISRDLLRRADDLTPEEAKQMTSDLESHQDVYRRTENLPTWPIDLRIAVKFGTAQVVPLLGLTGLSQPIIDVVGSLIGAGAGG